MNREPGAAAERGSEGCGIRVLAAEDSPVARAMLRAMLAKWGYDPVVARDGLEAWRELNAEDPPRLAILDWMMPGLDGVEICRRVRAAEREPYTYLLLLTAKTGSQDLVEGMEAGADDYLRKPFEAEELRVRMRAGRRILDLQEQLVAAREKLREQATHDYLTGLYNRGAALEALRRNLARAARESGPLALVMCDIDCFKSINDRYGHPAGDEVLCEAAVRMRDSMRHYDIAGRYGGEEFLFVLPGTAESGARAQAERMRETFAAKPFPAGGESLPVTCSFGVSWRDVARVTDETALIQEADQALYSAKAHGRNRVECYAGVPAAA